MTTFRNDQNAVAHNPSDLAIAISITKLQISEIVPTSDSQCFGIEWFRLRHILNQHILYNCYSKVLSQNNLLSSLRISLTGLVNEERLPKTDKMLPEIGDGVIISRDRATGDVTLTKLCRKDVFMMVKLLHLNFFLRFC